MVLTKCFFRRENLMASLLFYIVSLLLLPCFTLVVGVGRCCMLVYCYFCGFEVVVKLRLAVVKIFLKLY